MNASAIHNSHEVFWSESTNSTLRSPFKNSSSMLIQILRQCSDGQFIISINCLFTSITENPVVLHAQK
jgi:hypothetical protein